MTIRVEEVSDRDLWYEIVFRAHSISSPSVLFNSNHTRICIFDNGHPVLAYQFTRRLYKLLGCKVKIALSYGLHGIGVLLTLKKPNHKYFLVLLDYLKKQEFDVFNITISPLELLDATIKNALENSSKCIVQYTFLANLKRGFKYYFTKAMNKKARNLVRKFRKHGVVRIIDPITYGKEIVEINRSFILKQGKLVFKHYIDPLTHYLAAKRRIEEYGNYFIVYGAFINNRLVGYAYILWYNNVALIERFMSHKEYMKYAVSNGLLASILEDLSNKGIKYVYYGYWYHPAYPGLNHFLFQNGFKLIPCYSYYIPLSNKGVWFLRLHLNLEKLRNTPIHGFMRGFLSQTLRKVFPRY